MADFNPLAFAKFGQEQMNSLYDQRAQRQAGNALAAGDPTTARNALYQSGNISEGRAVERYQQGQEDHQRELNDDERKQHAEVILQATSAIRNYKRARPDATPQQAWDAVSPMLSTVADPNRLSAFKDAFGQNPDGFLAMVEGEAKKALQPVNLGSGGFGAFDPNEPDPKKSLTVVRNPFLAPTVHTVGEGQDLYETPREGGPPRLIAKGRPRTFAPNSADRIDSTGKVLGPIYDKIARGGLESLTPGERQLYDDAHRQQGFSLFGSDYGDEEAPAPPAAAAAAAPAATPKRPAAAKADTGPPPAAAFSGMKEGGRRTFGNGQVWTIHNGRPERMK